LTPAILLLISIALNVWLIVLFKLYGKFKVNNLYAIVINYYVCYFTAWSILGENPTSAVVYKEVWFIPAVLLGFVFIVIFNVVALATQKIGIAVTIVFQKMSMIFPVILGLALFSEDMHTLKVLGILTALASVVFLNMSEESKSSASKKEFIFLSMLILFGSGIIEGGLFLLEQYEIVENADIKFVANLFLNAGIIGLLIIIYNIIKGKASRFTIKDLIGGILLGIPNFFTIYLILKILNMGWEGSRFFPLNNVGILALSALVGFLFFREKLNKYNLIGLVLAIVTILLLR